MLRDISFLPDYVSSELETVHVDCESIQAPLRNVISFHPWSLESLMCNVHIEVSIFTAETNFNRKWISSYTLKTLVLFEWERNPAVEQWTGSNVSERFLNILNNLLLCLKQGGLRSFFYNDYNVLPNKDDNNNKIHPVNRVTILHHCILSIRNASKYRFEDCLENTLKEVKLSCQKMKLTHFLCQGLGHRCHQELNQVITRTTKDWMDSKMIVEESIFCDIYIQALLGKIAPEEKLILINPKRLNKPQAASFRKAVELFKDIAGTRMKRLENLPSYNLWSQEFKSTSNEIAKLFEVLFSIFKKDIEILLNKLEK